MNIKVKNHYFSSTTKTKKEIYNESFQKNKSHLSTSANFGKTERSVSSISVTRDLSPFKYRFRAWLGGNRTTRLLPFTSIRMLSMTS